MSRNTHHRYRDHMGQDIDTNIVTYGDIGGWPSGTSLHTVLSGVAVRTTSVSVVIYGGVGVITTGSKATFEIPIDVEIVAARLVGDVIGSLTVDIRRSTWATFPPTASICGGNPPSFSGARTYQDTTLTGWTTALSAGDWLSVYVSSAATVTQATVSLTFQTPLGG